MKVLVINGPNLNMLGKREVHIYKDKSYKDLVKVIKNESKKLKLKVKTICSNYEGRIIYLIQKSKKYDFIILNPGALTHYSIAIRDAITSVETKAIEVHLTDIYNREDFRKVSVIKDVCINSFVGNHFDSYIAALKFIKNYKSH